MKSDFFYDQVYEIARLIPKGRVTSYGAIATGLLTGKHHYDTPTQMQDLLKELSSKMTRYKTLMRYFGIHCWIFN